MDIFRQRDLIRPNSLFVGVGLSILTGLVLGTASLVLSPVWVLAGLLAGSLMLLVFKKPELAILGYLVLTSTVIPQNGLPRASFGLGRLMLTDLIIFALFAYIIVQSLVYSNRKIRLSPLGILFILFYLAGLLSTLYHIYVAHSLTLEESLGELRVFNHYLLFFAVINILREKNQIRFFIKSLFFLAIIAAASVVVQYVLGPSNPIVPGRVETLDVEGATIQGVTRILTPGESLLLFVMVVSLVMLLTEKSDGSSLFRWSMTVLIILGVLLTFNRSFWIGTLISMALLFLVVPRQLQRRFLSWVTVGIPIAILALAVMALYPKSDYSHLLSASFQRLYSLTQKRTYQSSQSSLRWRDFEYEHGFIKLMETPVIGTGLGAMYRPFVFRRDRPGFDGRRYMHNGHLYLLVKTGLLGYICFFSLSVLFIYRGLKYWRKIPDPKMGTVVLGLALGYLGAMVVAIVDPLYSQWYSTPVIGVAMGLSESIIAAYLPA
jgi:hypothetical protein